MKKIVLYTLIGILLFPAVSSSAQPLTQNNIRFDNLTVKKETGRIAMDMFINLDNLDLGTQQMIILTPMLHSADKRYEHRFAPVVITGGVRDKVLSRAMDFNGYTFETSPTVIYRRHNNQPESIPLFLSLPYDEWMTDASLYMHEEMLGCACDTLMDNAYNLKSPLLFRPQYVYSYVTPEVEPVKQRSETHTARLNFEVNRYNLLRDFKNNAEVLDEVDKIVQEVRNDPNLTVNSFKITGYASPEGNEKSNMTLSENRAKSFVTYLQQQYNISPSSMQVDWKGEDWEGLRKVVSGLDFPHKDEVLNVLDEPDNQRRKSRLHAINKGETYRMLLREYYPPLRRNEYTISYIARGFNAEEAKQLIYTKPQQLSLNEMFMVANTYPSDSEQFKEVFDIATRMFPNDPVAQLNSATRELEHGDTGRAIRMLEQINLPDAWNNLGIAYAMKEDYQKANEYFNKAINAGNQTAADNAAQLSKLTTGQ